MQHIVKPGTELTDRGVCVVAKSYCGKELDYPGMKLPSNRICKHCERAHDRHQRRREGFTLPQKYR